MLQDNINGEPYFDALEDIYSDLDIHPGCSLMLEILPFLAKSPFPFIKTLNKILPNFMVNTSIVLFPVLMFMFLLQSLRMTGHFSMIMLSGSISFTMKTF